MKKFVVLSIIILIIGLSLLAAGCAPESKEPLKGMDRGTTEQLKMTLKGLY